jgi:hypothetical protein
MPGRPPTGCIRRVPHEDMGVRLHEDIFCSARRTPTSGIPEWDQCALGAGRTPNKFPHSNWRAEVQLGILHSPSAGADPTPT